MKANTDILSYLAHFFLELETFETKIVRNIKTEILSSITPPPLRKSRRIWDNVEKYGTAGQATDDNMTHANYMLDN
jgi:hypothetical protein